MDFGRGGRAAWPSGQACVAYFENVTTSQASTVAPASNPRASLVQRMEDQNALANWARRDTFNRSRTLTGLSMLIAMPSAYGKNSELCPRLCT